MSSVLGDKLKVPELWLRVLDPMMERSLNLSMDTCLNNAARSSPEEKSPERPRLRCVSWQKTGAATARFQSERVVRWSAVFSILSMALLLAAMFALALRPGAALEPGRRISQYGHQIWQTDSGLPQNTVRAMLQTRDGYMWFATRGGVARFDGIAFTTFNRRNTPALRSDDVRSLMEDGHGNLWISTSNGLTEMRAGRAEEQGDSVVLYTTADGLPDNSVWSVFEDKEGGIWAVTAAGLGRFAQGKFEPFTMQQGLASNTVNMVADGPKASLLVAGEGGLDEIREGRVAARPISARSISAGSMKDAAASQPVRALAGSASGGLWLATEDGLVLAANGARRTYTVQDGLPSNDIRVLLLDHAGRVWAGTPAGLAVFADGKFTVWNGKNGLPGDEIETLHEDRAGSMWVAANHGVARIASSGGSADTTAAYTTAAYTTSAYTTGEGLLSNQVLAIYEDREGSVWLGSESAGVEILRDQKFVSYTTRDGLSDDVVTSVMEGRGGDGSSLWIGTDGGGLNQMEKRLSGAGISLLTTKQGLASDRVFALASDASGDVWVGTPNGLARLHNGKVSVLTVADGLGDDFVRSLLADRDGSLWIGTRHGLSHLVKGIITTYTQADGLANDYVGALAQSPAGGGDPAGGGPAGGLWIGTLGGLSHLAKGAFKTFTTADGLSANVVTALYVDAGGNLWIGTNGEGLNVLPHQAISDAATGKPDARTGKPDAATGKPVKELPDSLGLPDVVYGILEDGNQKLWLSSNAGIFRVDRNDLLRVADGHKGKVPVAPYGTADGMSIRECNGEGHPSACRTEDGRLWFSTLKGVVSIDPAHIQQNAVPPPVAIEQVLVDDVPVGSAPPGETGMNGGGLKVAAGNKRVSFRYTGMSFVAPQQTTFKYRLAGFDRDWIDAATRREAYYTNLPPGSYTFEVLARNHDGVWSTAPAMFRFRQRAHLYQTYWFYLMCVLGLVLLGWLIYRWRLKQVESRFRAVLAERNRIAREIHDTLAQGYVGISLQLELVARMLSSAPEAVKQVHEARQQVDDTRTLVRDSLAEARRSIWNLRAESADEMDLAARLARATREQTAGTAIETKVQVTGAYRAAPDSVEDELLKIGREAVANVRRHAQATRIDIRLEYRVGRLCLLIADNGCGFDPNAAFSAREGHFGLLGLRERAESLGGTLCVESSPGNGTTISVEIGL